MKEARIQVKLPLNAPTVGEAVENEAEAEAALQSVAKKDKPSPVRIREEQAHAPIIELDHYRVVKRRRMKSFGQSQGWGQRNPRGWQPVAAVSTLVVVALIIPAILVWPNDIKVPPSPAPAVQEQTSTSEPSPVVPVAYPEPEVRVYLSGKGTTMTLPLEEYVAGVIAAEMPSDFQLEALKAQAIAARTFIVRRLEASDTSGVPGGAADVTDTVSHQVFLPPDEVKTEWTKLGKTKDWEKLQQAVRESKDTVMTYQGRPITASFFSTSNGYTENAEDVWGNAVPYLKSVDSPWDKKVAPGFEETVTMSRSEILRKLQLGNDAIPATAQNGGSWMEVLSTTAGHRIKQVRIGGKVFGGPEVRNLLGLRSSQFTWAAEGDEVRITTYGYGHGVGMSQWGANGMAQEGYTATQILKHYYTGISFGHASKMLAKQ